MRSAAAILVALCAACSLREPRVHAASCSSSRECDSHDVCFLGECRGRSAALSIVVAEVRPPTGSAYGQAQRGGIDLRNSVVQDLELERAVDVTGTVFQGGFPQEAATVTFANRAPVLPDRVDRAVARTSLNGSFTIRLPAGVWDAFVEPTPPLPPAHFESRNASDWNGYQMTLPSNSDTTPVTGTVRLNGIALPNAGVAAFGPDGSPVSVAATTAGDGSFSFLIPNSVVQTYSLQIGPSADPSTADLPSYDGVTPSPRPTPQVDLAATPPATLQGVIMDNAGIPIAGASVYALYSDAIGRWRMLRTANADANGAYSLKVRQGKSWSVVAAPPQSDPNGIEDRGNPVDINGPVFDLPIKCPPKPKASGRILQPNGNAVGGRYQITATRLPDKLVTSRTAYASPTDDVGLFHLIGDHGEYRLEIQPPQGSGLPRKLVRVLLDSDGTEVPLPQPIQLSPPLEVVGTVKGVGGSDVIGGATVDFYALDSTGTHSMYLGGGLTNTVGVYRAILPDVPKETLTP